MKKDSNEFKVVVFSLIFVEIEGNFSCFSYWYLSSIAAEQDLSKEDSNELTAAVIILTGDG